MQESFPPDLNTLALYGWTDTLTRRDIVFSSPPVTLCIAIINEKKFPDLRNTKELSKVYAKYSVQGSLYEYYTIQRLYA
jgi:hypothetical protein